MYATTHGNATKQKKRAPSAYAQFVKANYAATRATHKRSQDRIKHIASLWRAHNASPPSTRKVAPRMQTQNKNKL
jgi:hypothetical protein